MGMPDLFGYKHIFRYKYHIFSPNSDYLVPLCPVLTHLSACIKTKCFPRLNRELEVHFAIGMSISRKGGPLRYLGIPLQNLAFINRLGFPNNLDGVFCVIYVCYAK